jgi:hypothetical protein
MTKEQFSEAWTPEPFTGCWIWTRGVTSRGYGALYQNGQILAHRFSYQVFKGAIPEGLHVLHNCDTPSCVNPDHLYLGTHADNMLDKKRKGRCATTKLTDAQVAEIKLSSESGTSLAKRFGVYGSTISDIRTRTTWKHI